MVMNLTEVKRRRATLPPRIIAFGESGIGKTTLAASFPDPVFIQTEDGTPSDLELFSFGQIEKFSQVMEAIGSLYAEEHNYKTLVVDSITELQRHVWQETCNRGDDKGNKKRSIEDFGYGKGYIYAQRVWQEYLDGINALRRDIGMTIVMIAHSTIVRFDDPETFSYDRYQIDLHPRSVGMIEREVDAILFLKKAITIKKEDIGFNKERSIAEGGSNIFIHTESRPAFVAKNRYGMPAKIKLEKDAGYSALAPYFPSNANYKDINYHGKI